MKASSLKKDKSATVRINSTIKQSLDNAGVSIQSIVDAYIDRNYEANEAVSVWKKRKKKK